MTMVAKFYNLSMHFHHPADLPSVWAVHVLDFDVITQGDDLQHALKMAVEASALVVQWDVVAGKDPADRRAPPEDWDTFFDVVTHGQATAGLENLVESKIHTLAVQALCLFQFEMPNSDAEKLVTIGTSVRKSKPKAPAPVLQRQPVVWPTAA
jgi:hypothetical protein